MSCVSRSGCQLGITTVVGCRPTMPLFGFPCFGKACLLRGVHPVRRFAQRRRERDERSTATHGASNAIALDGAGPDGGAEGHGRLFYSSKYILFCVVGMYFEACTMMLSDILRHPTDQF